MAHAYAMIKKHDDQVCLDDGDGGVIDSSTKRPNGGKGRHHNEVVLDRLDEQDRNGGGHEYRKCVTPTAHTTAPASLLEGSRTIITTMLILLVLVVIVFALDVVPSLPPSMGKFTNTLYSRSSIVSSSSFLSSFSPSSSSSSSSPSSILPVLRSGEVVPLSTFDVDASRETVYGDVLSSDFGSSDGNDGNGDALSPTTRLAWSPLVPWRNWWRAPPHAFSAWPSRTFSVLLMNRTLWQKGAGGAFPVMQRDPNNPNSVNMTHMRLTLDHLFGGFYESLCATGTPAIVFHDLADELVLPYHQNTHERSTATCNVIMQRVIEPPNLQLHTFDLRWRLYRAFLAKHPHRFVMFTDVSDVRFDRHPFAVLFHALRANDTRMWLGTDGASVSHRWLMTHSDACGIDVHEYADMLSLNVGVWAAHYPAAMWYLHHLNTFIDEVALYHKTEIDRDECFRITIDMVMHNELMFGRSLLRQRFAARPGKPDVVVPLRSWWVPETADGSADPFSEEVDAVWPTLPPEWMHDNELDEEEKAAIERARKNSKDKDAVRRHGGGADAGLYPANIDGLNKWLAKHRPRVRAGPDLVSPYRTTVGKGHSAVRHKTDARPILSEAELEKEAELRAQAEKADKDESKKALHEKLREFNERRRVADEYDRKYGTMCEEWRADFQQQVVELQGEEQVAQESAAASGAVRPANPEMCDDGQARKPWMRPLPPPFAF